MFAGPDSPDDDLLPGEASVVWGKKAKPRFSTLGWRLCCPKSRALSARERYHHCMSAASHHHGQSMKITTPASSCAMRMGRRSAISISKKILGDDRRASCSPKMRPEGSL